MFIVSIHSLAGSLTIGARLGSYSGGLPTAGYAAELISNGQVKLWRLSDWAQLGSTYTISGFQANQQVTLGIRANGTTISVEVDGVTCISVTESSFSSGEVGLWSYDPSSTNQHVFDDFLVQNLGQGSIPGGKVFAAQKALAQPRLKTAPRQAMGKSAFTLTRQTGQVWTSYYYAGAARAAMREVNDEGSEVYYILTDHLGSTSITVNDGQTQWQYYTPWGEYRPGSESSLPTDYTYTGQRDPGWGLYFYRARWYDSALGRFNQADSWIPNLGDPIMWDRYAYVRNNPVNLIDPTGHFCVNFNGRFICSSDTDSTGWWNPSPITYSLRVNLASSIGANKPKSQYMAFSNPTHYNLCGDLALEMVYETITGQSNSLGQIYGGSPPTREWNTGTNAYELGQQFAATFPTGSHAMAFYSSYIYCFEAGNPTHLAESPGALAGTWHQYDPYRVLAMIERMLDIGHYVIAGVYQNPQYNYRLSPSGVGHWVVITSISSSWVTINNPFTNREEKYSWDDFYNSFAFWLLEVIPSNPNNPIPY